MLLFVLTLFLSLFLKCNTLQYEGDNCVVASSINENGKCISIQNCEYAKKLLRGGKHPQTCGFKGNDALVCCPISQRVTELQVGNKSRLQCDRFYDKKSIFFAIDIGRKALSKEFPHMAAIGYGDDKANIVWLCGGTLISREFVLTAAHCVSSKDFGPARWVRLGDLDLKNTTDDADPLDLQIIQTFVHPEYKSRSHYHDIALLKLEINVIIGSYYKPACLHIERDVPNTVGAAGWGRVGLFGDPSSHLMKVNLQIVDYGKCARRYSDVSKTKLKDGILDELQICAGNAEGGDTCPGDSGGPLHYKSEESEKYVKHFVVAGITSFGRGCGGENSIGVYTRVSAYVGWIENIVWP